MPATVRFEFGNMFETPADVVAIPCSSTGTITALTKEHLSRYGIPRPLGPVELGHLAVVKLPEGERRLKFAAFAAAVSGNTSSRDVVGSIGRYLGLLTRDPQIRVISAPLFGTGAGGLDVVISARALRNGFCRTADDRAELLIHVMERGDFALLERLNPGEEQMETKPGAEYKSDPAKPLMVTERASATPHAANAEPATQQKPNRTSVFISYSRKDRNWLERLQVHLRPLERDHALEVWDDTRIQPGAKWKDEIQNALSRAKAAILLVSADFLASEFIAKNELPPLLQAAEEDGALILPVIVNSCLFTRSPLAAFQAANNPEKPLKGLRDATRERILSEVAEAVARKLLK